MEENKLDQLKVDYGEIRKKYSLPSFDELNEDFSIERISESDTDILIREIRKSIGDKIMSYLRFIEGILNPSNVPMFIYSITKTLSQEERKKLSEIYKELVKKEIEYVILDVKFDENEESKFIKESFESWQKIKEDLLTIMKKVNENLESKTEHSEKGYFG